MNILVTGGAGFIGKYVVKFLIDKGNSVTIFDNFSNSTKEGIKFLRDMNAKVIEGDITNIQDLENAINGKDTVIHLAAKISVSDSIINPSKTFRVNVDGTDNVLNACEKNNVKKIIISSSAAVYGESSSNVRLTEKSPLNPISPYGESKVRMEQNVEKFVVGKNMKYVILRFFNIYGIGQSLEYAGVITKFLKKIIEEKPLQIFGEGLQTRDFVAIHDVVNAVYNALTYEENGIFNIASGKTITIKKLAEQMISLSNKRSDIQFLNEKPGDIKYSQADISNAKKLLKYTPRFELNEGIDELLKSKIKQ